MSNLNTFIVQKNYTLKQAMEQISAGQRGAVVVVNDSGMAVGILSDGDVRRALLRDASLITPVEKVMNINFVFCKEGEGDADTIFNEHPGISILPVLDRGNKVLDVMVRERKEKMFNYYQNKRKEVFEGNRIRLEHVLQVIRKNFSQEKKISVLNIGVGSGIFEEMAFKAGFDIFSLDPDTDTINALREKFGSQNDYANKAFVGYVQNMSFPENQFDVVVTSELFELLSDPQIKKGVAEVQRVLKKGGMMVGTVLARERLEDSMVYCPNCGNEFHRWGHIQSFDYQSLKNKLSISMPKVQIYERFFPMSSLNWKGAINSLMKKFLTGCGAQTSSTTFVFIARKD